MPETTEFCDFQLEKCIPIISLQALRRQFSKMEDAGNIEVPECSSSTLSTNWSKLSSLFKTKKGISGGLFEIFRSF